MTKSSGRLLAIPIVFVLVALAAGAQPPTPPTPTSSVPAVPSPSPAASPTGASPVPSPAASATAAPAMPSPATTLPASPGASPAAAPSGAPSGEPSGEPSTPVETAASSATPAVAPTATPLVLFPTTPGPLPSGISASGNPTVIVVNTQPTQTGPTANSWIPGLIGIGLLAVAITVGVRIARQRGLTVESGLKQLGVDLPQDGIASVPASRPAPANEPPLPSLSDLPPPQPAQPAPPSMPISSLKPKVVDAPRPMPVADPGRATTAGANLLGLNGSVVGEVFPFESEMTIGREKDNSLSLPGEGTVSRRHARIEEENGAWIVTDLGSSNGTYINGKRLTAPQALRRGDEVQFGSLRFRFEA
ncbi:MAG: FHA domain-containing protein [Capsulimonadales bacterium]|nr:FHA domain-containing protein [Capsulimonadales bacterium]